MMARVLRLGAMAGALALAVGSSPAWAADDDEDAPAAAAAAANPAPKKEDAAPAGPVAWSAQKMEAYLDAEFPKTVIAPAVDRTLQRIFLTDDDVTEQAREAVQAAMSKVAREGRGVLGDVLEAIVAKDRAAAEEHTKKLVSIIDAKGGYWERAIGKFFPDVSGRARPLVRVGVARAYRCDNFLLGSIMGVKAKSKAAVVAIVRKKMRSSEQNEACKAVRKWAENRALAEIDKLIEDLQKHVKGEAVTLDAAATKLGDAMKKSLERELVTIVGEYREGMGRIRQAAERIIEELPAAAAKPEEKKPAAPATEEKKTDEEKKPE